MPGTVLPPFPEDVPLQPLPIVDFELVKNGEVEESAKLWSAATELGFWYLKNHGATNEADGMFAMGDETMSLSLEEKMKYSSGTSGKSFGYKAAGSNVTDDKGTRDTAEFLNISKDDVLSYPAVTHRSYPEPVQNHMDSVLKPFVNKSLEVTRVILSMFEKKLSLPAGALLDRHSLGDHSRSEARCIKNPGWKSEDGTQEKLAIGAHSDFGSLSFLHNRLGGLQVLAPDSSTWRYVKPIPGHAICNVGDTLTIFSGGILRSALHRVLPAPGEQAPHTRWSIVFFLRPGSDVVLHALTEQSSTIADTVTQMTDEERDKFFPNQTAGEWHVRRVKGRKVIMNSGGLANYDSSAGMEHNKSVFRNGLTDSLTTAITS